MLAYRSFVCQTPKTKNQKAFSTPLSQKRFAHRHPKLHPHEFNSHTGEKYFDKILVANRGEIACRVIRTAKRLGIKTVAIYSEPDVNSVHVRLADEAYCVGPALSKDSYLNIPNILQAIKESGAQAVHPGYGFLSENPEFVKTLEKNGVVFLGPDSHAMHAMGDKIESKKLAKSAGVNTIPGFLGEVEDEDHVLKIAKEIGYPVMIKASSGGGGKGMRIAWNDHEAIEGFRLSKQEARSSFGSDRMLIEKFIDNPRHIEIQVMCDGQGTYLYLPERECSIQRRNQKVIEEAPSVHLDEATRTAMGKQAVALAEAVKYRSAGTVEFLVDSKRNFYFLEMNTRLQVEHPITEYITGIDLVEQMIRVGAGKKLAIQQKDITIKGWAIESRVYAEDPLKNFLPCIGHLLSYKEPPTGPTVRCDSGIQEGSEISVFYDPLISKLVTWGNDRQEAIKRMATALDLYVIGGLTHNVNFLRDLCEHPRFLSGKLSTKFIPEEFPNGYHGHFLNPEEEVQLAAISGAIDFLRRQRDLTVDNQTTTFDHSMYDNLSLVIRPQDGGKTYTVKVSKKTKGNEKQLELLVTPSSSHSPAPSSASGKGKSSPSAPTATSPADGAPISITLSHDWPIDTTIFECEVNGKHCIAQLLGTSPLSYKLQFVGTIFNVQVATEKQSKYLKHMIEHVDTKSLNYVTSPMPGMLLSFAVKAGDKVHKGQELAVVEAMKMQNIIRAERDGVVKAVLAKPGSEVANEQVLVEFE